jgi:hypothetical protein
VRRVEARYAKGHDMSKLKIRVGEVEDDMLVRRGGVDVRCVGRMLLPRNFGSCNAMVLVLLSPSMEEAIFKDDQLTEFCGVAESRSWPGSLVWGKMSRGSFSVSTRRVWYSSRQRQIASFTHNRVPRIKYQFEFV